MSRQQADEHHDHLHNAKPPSFLGKPPPCHLTAITIALTSALVGLVLLGIGAVIAGFQWQESFARIIGLLIVVAGGIMMILGVGIYAYDLMRPGKLTAVRDRDEVAIHDMAAPNHSNVERRMQSPSREPRSRNAPADAPPSYDSVLEQEVNVSLPADSPHCRPHATTTKKRSTGLDRSKGSSLKQGKQSSSALVEEIDRTHPSSASHVQQLQANTSTLQSTSQGRDPPRQIILSPTAAYPTSNNSSMQHPQYVLIQQAAPQMHYTQPPYSYPSGVATVSGLVYRQPMQPSNNNDLSTTLV